MAPPPKPVTNLELPQSQDGAIAAGDTLYSRVRRG